YEDKSGKWRFRLKAGNGEIIATGQGYSSKSGALGGIDSIRRNAAEAEVVETEE
ncbi:MAG: YegP family protein, partial [Actinobacteria bacterium]|nr:YegP family protein [Actinomycetota bacterium]